MAISTLADFRDALRAAVDAGENRDDAARRILRDANPHALVLDYARTCPLGSSSGFQTFTGRGGRHGARATPDQGSNEPDTAATVRPNRWQVVSEMSQYHRAWGVAAPDGRRLQLGQLTADELEELAEQCESDAEKSEWLAKRCRRLAEEIRAHPRAQCADALPADVVEEVFES